MSILLMMPVRSGLPPDKTSNIIDSNQQDTRTKNLRIA